VGQVKKLVKESLMSLLPGNSPGFLIIGAQKSGTSSLHFYLNAHPEIVRGRLKENNFFNDETNYKKGITWYENHFKHPLKTNKLFFEASPIYLYNKKSAERIYNYNPGMKLIAILRNPVDRAYSSWNMYRNFFVNKKIPDIITKGEPGTSAYSLFKYLYDNRNSFPTFKECVDHELKGMESNFKEEEPSFIRRGIYYLQLAEYFKYFSKDQIMVIGFKELSENKIEMLADIEDFLKIKHYNFNNAPHVTDKIVISKQKVRYAEKIEASVKAELTEYFSSWNKKLFELLGKELNW
jgi:sulfotransferase family protein